METARVENTKGKCCTCENFRMLVELDISEATKDECIVHVCEECYENYSMLFSSEY